jgi:hypothetical protein
MTSKDCTPALVSFSQRSFHYVRSGIVLLSLLVDRTRGYSHHYQGFMMTSTAGRSPHNTFHHDHFSGGSRNAPNVPNILPLILEKDKLSLFADPPECSLLHA